MISREKRKALLGLGIGLPLFIGFVVLGVLAAKARHAGYRPFGDSTTGILLVLGLLMLIVSLPSYLYGCAALARGKGYSTAILLTVILGLLFPLVVLLALPDKNKRHRRY
ncbi:MAG: hypothetical protein C5B50_14985 [Verrucomicrobia bacterium]|nr:MAG: hypothetical protein C5B50_14985 [Verrucomicrobiota bacterium]